MILNVHHMALPQGLIWIMGQLKENGYDLDAEAEVFFPYFAVFVVLAIGFTVWLIKPSALVPEETRDDSDEGPHMAIN